MPILSPSRADASSGRQSNFTNLTWYAFVQWNTGKGKLSRNSLNRTTEHTEVQLLINYAYPLLSQCAKKRYSPPPPNENSHHGYLKWPGGRRPLLSWLSYEKLNLCKLCEEYYTAVWRYEFYLLVVKTISYSYFYSYRKIFLTTQR